MKKAYITSWESRRSPAQRSANTLSISFVNDKSLTIQWDPVNVAGEYKVYGISVNETALGLEEPFSFVNSRMLTQCGVGETFSLSRI